MDQLKKAILHRRRARVRQLIRAMASVQECEDDAEKASVAHGEDHSRETEAALLTSQNRLAAARKDLHAATEQNDASFLELTTHRLLDQDPAIEMMPTPVVAEEATPKKKRKPGMDQGADVMEGD